MVSFILARPKALTRSCCGRAGSGVLIQVAAAARRRARRWAPQGALRGIDYM